MARLIGKNALICGDGRTIRVTAPFDITGFTVTFTVKPATALAADTDAGAVIQKVVTTHTDPTAGVTDIVLDGTDTRVTAGKYVFDIQFDNGSDSPVSSRRQDIEFVEDVTKTVL